MRKRGFTYIELMIAISIFAISIVMIMKLNITSEGNLNKQMESQKMMFVAQGQIEKYKTTLHDTNSVNNISTYPNNFTLEPVSGYYVLVNYNNVATDNSNVYLLTVWVRKSATDNSNEIKLQSHVLKN